LPALASKSPDGANRKYVVAGRMVGIGERGVRSAGPIVSMGSQWSAGKMRARYIPAANQSWLSAGSSAPGVVNNCSYIYNPEPVYSYG
jgi:hypothetical protein